MIHKYNTEDIRNWACSVNAGDEILLSGVVYTARDAAHKRFMVTLDHNGELPFPISGSVIYYTGPTPAKPGFAVGSCGPTTSSRMDIYTPRLLDLGLSGVIGKGGRNSEVTEALIRNKALYLCAIGGAGALACECITDAAVIAYDELGCESVKRLLFKDFPLFVGTDTHGRSIFYNHGS